MKQIKTLSPKRTAIWILLLAVTCSEGVPSGEFRTWDLGLGISCLAQGTWTQKADFGGTARQAAVGFSIGTKGYIGTGWDAAYPTDLWEYDSGTDSWTQKANITTGAGRSSAAGFAIGSKGYIGTGWDGVYRQDFWEYDAINDLWTQKADFGGTPRSNAVGFFIGSKGYIGLGWNGAGKQDFWEYDPTANSWVQKAGFGGTARSAAVAFSIGTKGYVGTGFDANGYTQDFWEYNPATDTWAQKTNFGGSARYTAVGFSAGAKGYIGLGSAATGNLQDFWEYDTTADIWTQKAIFPGIARVNTVGFSIGTKGYIGTGSNGGYTRELWEYTPDSIFTGTPSQAANSQPEILIYPNPNSGKFNVQMSKYADVQMLEIEIYNMLGQKVTRSVIPNGVRNLTIDLSSRPSGIYFVKINSESKQFIQKIIISAE